MMSDGKIKNTWWTFDTHEPRTSCQAKSYPIGKSVPLTKSSPSKIISYSKELNHIPSGNQFRSQEVRQAKSYPIVKSNVLSIGKSYPHWPCKIIAHHRGIISPYSKELNHIPSGNQFRSQEVRQAKSYPIVKSDVLSIGKSYPHWPCKIIAHHRGIISPFDHCSVIVFFRKKQNLYINFFRSFSWI